VIADLSFAPTMNWVMFQMVPMGPVVVSSGTTDLAASGVASAPSAWAASPVDGLIYGIQPFEQRLSSWDPANPGILTLRPLMIPQSTALGCSAAFLKNNDMIASCRTGGDNDILLRIDVVSNTLDVIDPTIALAAGDMASCPFDLLGP
jgi:hypothetical protein